VTKKEKKFTSPSSKRMPLRVSLVDGGSRRARSRASACLDDQLQVFAPSKHANPVATALLLRASLGGKRLGALLRVHALCKAYLDALEFKSCTPLSPVQLERAGKKCVRCAQHTHKLFYLFGAGECHPSFMEATGGSVKMFMCDNDLTQPQHRNTQREPNKHRPRQTDGWTDRNKQTPHTNTHTHTHTHTQTHTHLGGRSATCWAHLGCSHNERGTVATHTQVTTRRKQMRLHVASPLV
jgi:hypothetical protein